jgi:hypothetical protein
MKCFFFCRQQGSQSLMLTDTGEFRLACARLGCLLWVARRATACAASCFFALSHAHDALPVIDVATGRCETTAKLEAPALEAAFRATFGQLLAAMK